jgi:hypothetical protein
VFISYSRKDANLAEKLRAHLESIGARPMIDFDNRGGAKFTDEIKLKISFAHIFVSLLTNNSKNRPWVHQELGYAMGLRVPILPLTFDKLPEGMAHEIHAISLDSDLNDLSSKINHSLLDDVVYSSQKAAIATFECAEMLYKRTKVLVDSADLVLKQYGPARIRQRMAFSSFSIPNRNIGDADWDKREGLDIRNKDIRKELLEERRIMEKHAREAGCDLILDPYVQSSSTMNMPEANLSPDDLKKVKEASNTRLRILIDFLENMPDNKVRIAFRKGKIEGGIHIIGDWFVAEAVVPWYKGGFKQTIFTRHAPTVLHKLEEFDIDFNEALGDIDLKGKSSRENALITLKTLVK